MNAEVLICQNQKWLDTQNQLQPKALKLLNEVDKLFKANRKKKLSFNTPQFNERLVEFREMFPNGRLPTGKPARTNINELKKKMTDFFIKNPEYDWDLVLDATEYYVEHFRKQDYNYMKTAGYFISKNDESELASYCEMIKDGHNTSLIKKSMYNVS